MAGFRFFPIEIFLLLQFSDISDRNRLDEQKPSCNLSEEFFYECFISVNYDVNHGVMLEMYRLQTI